MIEKNFVPLEKDDSDALGVYVEQPDVHHPEFNENLDWEDGMLTYTDGFRPFRLVVDLKIENEEAEINFKIYITHSDARYRVEKLAKWDGSEWKEIDAPLILDHPNPIWAGYFDVKNYKLGDPSIAVGR